MHNLNYNVEDYKMEKKEYSIGIIKKIIVEKGYGLVNDGKDKKILFLEMLV